jgi:hypothetical protein
LTRQLNLETIVTKIDIQRATLWTLSLTTEGIGTAIISRKDSQTEVSGGLLYPATLFPTGTLAFQSDRSKISLIYATKAAEYDGD